LSDTIKSDANDPKVSIGLTCWIEDKFQLPELKRCLDSLVDFYPVIVVNGKWNDMKGENSRSIPEAQDLIDSYPNTIHFLEPNMPEYQNRNKCLIQAGKMGSDYLIWVDSDEWIEMPLGIEFFLRGLKDIFSNAKDMCSYCHFFDIGRGGNCRMPRIIRYPMFIRMRKKHNEWYFIDKNIRKRPLNAPRGLIIHSDKSYRTDDRHMRMFNRNQENPIH